MKIEIILTDAEAKAFYYVSDDPVFWATNVVKERCRIAMEEIFQMETKRMLDDPNISEIPADMEAVVLAADIQTAAERAALSPLQVEG